jgi:Tfp pilus assembly protein PilF
VSPYYLPVGSPAELAEQIRMTARRALEIDADNSEAYAALGSVQMAFDRDWAAAADALARAVRLSPSDAVSINLYGDYFYVIGDYASALTWETHAADLEPLSAVNQHELALVLRFLGRLDEAIERERRAIRLNPEFRNAWSALVRMLVESGQHEEARTLLTEQAALLSASSSLWLTSVLELVVGNRELARAAADTLAAEARLKQQSLTHAAYLFARLGDDHQAAELVSAAMAAGDPILVSPLYFFLPEDFPAMPQLRSALDQPELRALFNLRRINLGAGTGRVHANPD